MTRYWSIDSGLSQDDDSDLSQDDDSGLSQVVCFPRSRNPWPRQLNCPNQWFSRAAEAITPRLPLPWTVSIPLGEHRNIDLFSQSGLEQTHGGQVQ